MLLEGQSSNKKRAEQNMFSFRALKKKLCFVSRLCRMFKEKIVLPQSLKITALLK